MNLTHLQSFMLVAKMHSFSAASEQLGASKGLVSRHVKSLEDEMGCQLLHRTTRRVSMTEAGQALFGKACEIERLANEAGRLVQDLTQDSCGTLKFTAPTELGKKLLSPMLLQFIAEYPQVKLELCFEQNIQDVEFGKFDLALRTSIAHSDNLIARYLGRIRHVLVVSPAHPAAAEVRHPDDLRHYRLLSSGETQWVFEPLAGDSLTLTFEPALCSSNYATTHQLTLSGTGIASLPYYLVEEDIAQHKLTLLVPQWQCYPHELYMVYAKQSHYPKKLRDLQHKLQTWCETHSKYVG